MNEYDLLFLKKFRGPEISYCALCNSYGKLTHDHIPPKGAGNKGKFLIYNLPSKTLSIPSNNGVRVKSICSSCNNIKLSQLDEALVIFAKQTKKYLSFLQSGITVNREYIIEINPRKVAQCLAGHIIASSINLSVLEQEDKKENNYLELLHNLYNMKDGNLLIEFWIHNHPTINIFPVAAIALNLDNPNSISIVSILSFYPLGFLIIEKKNKANHQKNEYLDYTKEKQAINLSKLAFKSKHFPIDSPPKNGFIILTSFANITAIKAGELVL